MSTTTNTQRQEFLDRLRAMAEDVGETWDLSVNDQAAISFALEELGRICAVNFQMLDALEAALDEIHEFNLAHEYGNRPRNPELTQEAEVKIKAAIQKARGL